MNSIKVWNDKQIRIRPSDRYICLTDMAQAASKKVNDWLRLQSTTEFIQALAANLSIEAIGENKSACLIYVTQGGIPEEQGTWAHPKVAEAFKTWCLKSRNLKPNFLYVFGDKKRQVCKIGISSNPASRLSQIQSTYPWDLEIWYSLDLGDSAVVWEKKLHTQYITYRLNGEWFDSIVFNKLKSQMDSKYFNLSDELAKPKDLTACQLILIQAQALVDLEMLSS